MLLEPKSAGASLDEIDRRWAFLGVFASGLLAFVSIGITLPVLPRYIHGPIGAGDLAVGIVTGAFAATAVVCRPLAGRAADARGRRTIVVVGAALMALSGVLYFVPAGVPGLIAVRLILGVGEGFFFTAGATWVVDLAPPDRRGQAIGLFGLAIWTGLAVGPPLGEGLLALGGYDLVWAFAAGTPLAAALLARRFPDPHEPAESDERLPLFRRDALVPGISLSLAQVGYAALAGFVVLDLNAKGTGHGAVVFTAFAASVVGARLLGGRLPDRVGAWRCAVGAGLAEALGLGVIALAQTWEAAAAGAVLMGTGFSLLFPSLGLMVVSRTEEARRGAALGSFTAFFDVGFGLGGAAMGAIAEAAGYAAMFWAAAGAGLAGVLVTALTRR